MKAEGRENARSNAAAFLSHTRVCRNEREPRPLREAARSSFKSLFDTLGFDTLGYKVGYKRSLIGGQSENHPRIVRRPLVSSMRMEDGGPCHELRAAIHTTNSQPCLWGRESASPRRAGMYSLSDTRIIAPGSPFRRNSILYSL